MSYTRKTQECINFACSDSEIRNMISKRENDPMTSIISIKGEVKNWVNTDEKVKLLVKVVFDFFDSSGKRKEDVIALVEWSGGIQNEIGKMKVIKRIES